MFKFRNKDKSANPAEKQPLPAAEKKPAPPPAPAEPLPQRLEKPRGGLGIRLKSLFSFKRELDAELFEDLETLLLTADVGAEASMEIIEQLTARVKRKELADADRLLEALRELLLQMLAPAEQPLHIDGSVKPFVIMTVGVNGAGKTTTIGKLGQQLRQSGAEVLLAAGDTFRAAAVEQLKTWGERIGAPVIAQGSGADSASVIYDALQAARSRGADVLIADTAGRLHTQSNLMEELKKIRRVMGKIDEAAPHEVLLVLDGTTGQNALAQAAEFGQAVGVTGLIVTKLDGTAKGGVVFALARKTGLPIRFIGVGEKAEDLRVFNAREFVDALVPPDALAASDSDPAGAPA